jgi:hypothetical protein
MAQRNVVSTFLAAALCAAPAAAAGKPAPRRPASAAFRALQVLPTSVSLDGAEAQQTLVVTGTGASGKAVDLTATAVYRSLNPKVVQVSAGGVARIAGDGSAAVEVRVGSAKVRVPVRARHAARQRPLSFTNDVMPVLMKAGCYVGACHAKQGGQNGFQLSVLGFDPEADYRSVARQANGRRVNRLEPGKSLLLTKPTLTLPHAGGRRFDEKSTEYRLLARWIAEGAPFEQPGEPKLVRVEVEPRERVMAPKGAQHLLATAVYSDNSRRDITHDADFRSNEEGIATVENGVIRASELAGEAAVMTRYMGQVAVTTVTVPLKQPVSAAEYTRLPRQNYVDDLVYRKLSQLNLLPSDLCDDVTFLRRASLDLIGTLPTPAETRAFLAECSQERGSVEPQALSVKDDARKAKGSTLNASSGVIPAFETRAKLVERLLARPEYADYWGMRWVNLLLVDRDPLFPKGAYAYDHWVREAFRKNMPFDQFARDIVTASGETFRDGPANFYRALATPIEQAKSISQLFLGVRIDCAQCHHHPNERWSQDDFYSMAAYFARVRRKGSTEFEQIVYAAPDGEVRHPKTDQVMPPKPLGGAVPEIGEDEDRREALARWMTAPDNPYFAREIVNRTWALMLGRGIVEPVDDMRLTNPGTNEPLLDALAKDFVAHGYDVKYLLRTIAASAAYQRSSVATPNNAKDTHNYSRFYVKRLIAEVLLDAIGEVTGVPERFSGHPSTTRAIQMWDNKLPIEFLDVFGKPSRLSVCECDRPADGSVTQVLHLMNSKAIQNRLTSDKGMVERLEKSMLTPEQIVEEMYLTVYSRLPTPEESKTAQAAFTREKATRRTTIEDLLWVLLNSPEFIFNH